VGHVGDSRLYRVCGGRIEKITHDHSPVGEREDRGELGEDEAMRHPRRNEVYRDVGSEEHTPDDAGFIEIQRFEFEPASALVLCSDGLSDLVKADQIRRIVEQRAQDPERAARDLIAAANHAGGKDNVTAVVVMGEDLKAPEAVADPAVSGTRHSALLLIGLPILGALVGGAGVWGYKTLYPSTVTVVVQPQTLTVGRGERFTTIAGAMAQAKAGDTVEVLADEYREQVALKSGVAVTSKPPHGAILRAAPLSNGPAVVAENVNDARLAGFRIQGNKDDVLAVGIALRNSEVKIEDTEIAGTTIGIEIHGAGNATLRGNTIHDCLAQGLLIFDPATAWVSHNIFRRNQGAGVAAREGAQPWLVDNLFEKSSVELTPGEPMDAVRTRNVFLDARSGGRAPKK
jgi:hypothetical protein